MLETPPFCLPWESRFSQTGNRSKSENPTGTQDQEYLDPVATPARNLDSGLERAFARFGAAVAAKNGSEQGAG